MAPRPGRARGPARRRGRELSGPPGPPQGSPEALLAQAGQELAEALPVALERWVGDCVTRVLDAWQAAGAHVPEQTLERARRDAEMAGRRAAEEAGAALRELAEVPGDEQRTTPLEIVRRAVGAPTAVLAAAGVPELHRDRFSEERFPGDRYDLVPGSLAALSPELRELALRWGAAKAAVHRARRVQGQG